jgi:hypothetical protein
MEHRAPRAPHGLPLLGGAEAQETPWLDGIPTGWNLLFALQPVYGVYQIGDVYARSWSVAGTLSGRLMPKYAAS